MKTIGVRREDKNVWEKRAPIIPAHVRELAERHGIGFLIEPSPIRIFKEDEYRKAGASVSEDLSRCDVVFAIKEIPQEFFKPQGIYVFFSHTIKGQKHNMPMLKRLMELKCTLIDYEKIIDASGRRLVFFGRHAGLAGMIDSLWALGRRLEYEGIRNPFSKIKLAHEYHDLEDVKVHIGEVGEEIRSKGFAPHPPPLNRWRAGLASPLGGEGVVIGIAGYGHVAGGVQEILDCLPVKEIMPEEVLALPPHAHPYKGGVSSDKLVYKIVFKEEHTVEPRENGAKFNLQDYYSHPEKYKGCFEKYVPYLTVLMNCIYWDKRYPRLVTKDFLKKLYSGDKPPALRVIGDISCDVEGAIEVTVRCTDPGNPVFVYDVEKEKAVDWIPDRTPDPFDRLPPQWHRRAPKAACGGYTGRAGRACFSRETDLAKARLPKGPVILAVDNLPCELARESSIYFSGVLKKFIPEIASADYSVPFDKLALPPEIKRAVIVYKGGLTKEYRYLEGYLKHEA